MVGFVLPFYTGRVGSQGDIRLVVFVLGIVLVGIALALVGRFRANIVHPGGALVDVSLSEAEVHSNPQAIALTAKANDFLVRLKKICAEQGLTFVGADHFNPTSGRILQMDWEDYTGPQIELDSKDYTFKFWQSTNRLSFFCNEGLLNQRGMPLLDKIDVPNQTEEQCIDHERPFLTLIDFPADTNLGDPHARFQPQFELPKYRYGYWWTSWPRTDNEGHFFGCDNGVTMEITEGFAPSMIAVGLAVPYEKDKGAVMSEEQALLKAKQEIKYSRSGRSYTLIPNDRGIVDDKLKSSSLAIVEVLQKASSFSFGSKPKRTARLAWVFWFDPVFDPPIVGPTFNHSFEVSVDAVSGEIAGTDAML